MLLVNSIFQSILLSNHLTISFCHSPLFLYTAEHEKYTNNPLRIHPRTWVEALTRRTHLHMVRGIISDTQRRSRDIPDCWIFWWATREEVPHVRWLYPYDSHNWRIKSRDFSYWYDCPDNMRAPREQDYVRTRNIWTWVSSLGYRTAYQEDPHRKVTLCAPCEYWEQEYQCSELQEG